jgi:7,8-dihydropterin-6-yl-methyl-4-(beta-D-ribofuranosyl)aminobenzene 5'-phosphate synthase
VKVVVHPHLFLPRFSVDKTGKRRSSGVPKGEGQAEIEAAGGEIVHSAGPLEIIPGLWTTGQIARVTGFEEITAPLDGGKREIVVDGRSVNDEILDDQALWMDIEDIGPLVITGCAMQGSLIRFSKWRGSETSRIHGFIGETHLVGRKDGYIQQTIEELKRFDLQLLSPCHCTGFKATAKLYQAFSESFALNFCGRILVAGQKPDPRVI